MIHYPNTLILSDNLMDLKNIHKYNFIIMNGCIISNYKTLYNNIVSKCGIKIDSNEYNILFDLNVKFLKLFENQQITINNNLYDEICIMNLKNYEINYTSKDYFKLVNLIHPENNVLELGIKNINELNNFKKYDKIIIYKCLIFSNSEDFNNYVNKINLNEESYNLLINCYTYFLNYIDEPKIKTSKDLKYYKHDYGITISTNELLKLNYTIKDYLRTI